MADEVKAVEFVAEIRQVKTMADHTCNIILNLPEYCGNQSAWALVNQGSQVKGILVLVDDNGTNDNKSESGSNY